MVWFPTVWVWCCVPSNTTPLSTPNVTGSQRGARLAALDGLRLVAALFVVVYHYAGTSISHLWTVPNAQAFPGLYQVATYGYLGVRLFFIISGFVICMSSWDRPLKDFFVSRTVRLFPMYWAAIVISFLVVHFNAGTVHTLKGVVDQPKSAADILLNFTMAQSSWGVKDIDGVYWTLWVELRFYLLFAIVVWRGVTYKRVLTFCVLWLIATVITARIYDTLLQVVVQPTYAPYFIAGILMFLIYRTGSTPLLWGLVGLCYLLCVYQASSETTGMNGILHTSMAWRWSAVLITLFFVAVAAVALGWLSWAKWRWLTVAGALTYPLYLLHQDIGLIIIRSLRDNVPKWPLLIGTILAMMLAAYLGHRLIEKPIAPRFKRLLAASMDMNPPDRIKRAATASPATEPGAADGKGSLPGPRRDPQWSSPEEQRDPDVDPLLARQA